MGASRQCLETIGACPRLGTQRAWESLLALDVGSSLSGPFDDLPVLMPLSALWERQSGSGKFFPYPWRLRGEAVPGAGGSRGSRCSFRPLLEMGRPCTVGSEAPQPLTPLLHAA